MYGVLIQRRRFGQVHKFSLKIDHFPVVAHFQPFQGDS